MDCNPWASQWLQLIPATDWRDGKQASFNPPAEAYGQFMCRWFDAWFDRYRDDISVRLFDSYLMTLVHGQAGECTYSPSCEQQLMVEHNGDVYGCDHFVEPTWKLGHVDDAQWMNTLEVERFNAFAQQKQNSPQSCRQCQYWHLCCGGCPKHRHGRGSTPEPSTLCAAYQMFLDHTLDRLQWLAGYYRQNVKPPTTKQTKQRTRTQEQKIAAHKSVRFKRRKSRR